MNTSKAFRDYLRTSLVNKSAMNERQVEAISAKYDSLVMKSVNPERAFREILEAYGNEDTEKAVGSIQSELEKLSREHSGVDANPVTRIRKYIDRFNSKLEKLDVEVTGLDDKGTVVKLTQADRERLTLKEPKFLPVRGVNYVANATVGGKTTQLDMTVSY